MMVLAYRKVLFALAAALLLLGSAPPPTQARRARRAADPLDPLYRRIAKDLKAGKPLVVTVHVALCSNKQIWCGSKKLGQGDKPRTNLYWGGAAGFTAWFRWNGRRRYKRVYADRGDGKVVLARAVYHRRVKRPTARWKRFGVKKGFDVYVVGVAYRGRHIGKALGRFLSQTAKSRGFTLKLKGGKKLQAGGLGHLVGYAGHNHLMDTYGKWPWPKITRKQPVGYFMLACMSAQYVAARLAHRRTHAVLLTTVLMYPGAYTVDGLVGGISRAFSQRRVFRRAAAIYARHSKVKARTVRCCMFTHDGRAKFRRRFHRRAPRRRPR